MVSTTQIAIFASGAGSNAQKIIHYFRNHPSVQVALVVCNRPSAGVLTIAQQENMPFVILEKEKFFSPNHLLDMLHEKKIDFLVLAGFLWMLPVEVVRAYPKKIINIHPALLPKYGGRGMYGDHVHQAVIDNKEPESGITIHYADEVYDHGQIILQAKCLVPEHETVERLAARIHVLEHRNFSKTIELIINLQNIVKTQS
jgi:phosphoribosylglycinamide formyltransferase-1